MTRCVQAGLTGQSVLALRNRQRRGRVDLRMLRRIVRALLREACPRAPFDLAIHIVSAPEITGLNETFLHHQGPTDVITFDYAEPTAPPAARRECPALLHGEIVVCLDAAVSQARRFHTTWQSEVVRYVVHGVLHLLGEDDRTARAHRRMKAAEDALVRRLAGMFDFSRLGFRQA